MEDNNTFRDVAFPNQKATIFTKTHSLIKRRNVYTQFHKKRARSIERLHTFIGFNMFNLYPQAHYFL